MGVKAQHGAPVPITMTSALKIMSEVSAEFGVTSADMVGPSRLRTIAFARFVAWRRMRDEIRINHMEVSLPRIGSWFGRHHSSIISGLRRLEEPKVQAEIDRLRSAVIGHEINAEQPVNNQVLLWPNRRFYGRINHGAAALPTPAAPLVANT